MRVTPDMTTEGGTLLIRDADFLGVDDTGIQSKQDAEHVRVTVDSTAYPNKTVWLDPDDAEALGLQLIAQAAEARKARA
jgi:hypothetical protein